MENSNIRIGVVQGRLTKSPPDCLQWFPQEQWRNEFNIASELGIDYIELIAETHHNEGNPIWTDEGIREIKGLVKDNHLTLHALCNDYIIKHSLLDGGAVVQQSLKLIEQGSKLGVEKFVLPLFECSEITPSNMRVYVEPLQEIGKAAYELGMVTCLETILTGEELSEFLKLIDRPFVKAVYDTGNRVAFGHDLAGDIRILKDSIAHVHIKDKDKNNNNVLLGTGLVNFSEVFDALSDIEYRGPFTFETTRGTDPLNTAIYNIQLVTFFERNSKNAL